MRGHSLKKFYGSDWTRRTPGLTWGQIAQKLEDWVYTHGKFKSQVLHQQHVWRLVELVD